VRRAAGIVASLVVAWPALAEITRDCEACPELVEIPSGTFMMGSTPAETAEYEVRQHHAVVEWPRHEVTVANAFMIGRYEVTRAQYRAFAEATGRDAAECLEYDGTAYQPLAGSSWRNPPFAQQDDHPVVCVTWDDAAAYARWIAEATGKNYRLPSEAEWEYAARAGTEGARHWRAEDGDACAHANVADRNSPRPQFDCEDPWPYTAPVSYGIANEFGLYGVLGNVGELVADCGLPDYAEASGDTRAVMQGDCGRHVGRGGSWWNDAYYLRSARRYSFAGAYSIVGFRVVREP
jgi:formylglycine-generating enzyme required for sulfatase activity